ncbi:60S ribosome subunit biogenesis protein NIP7 [Gonapodya prolifera JEL478]|uniref:60S ribosome subunit biogenesis protein NIP7 n=1 Tax=Gonapodya prolifera (strain JEL478) TaxID=1344416 RepID=A0A139AF16_GONPJ|nr:60S ribosome subunit biogenesis protein NIP7 [Gonapodya prolifera JEL478]|eukprot:KXS15348.1 60S ribosome subunit biogenesis protein NIP7 [Gonapodya prolifera JEL478]
MRPLIDDETKVFFEKLAKYIGKNIAMLIDRPGEQYCFRLQKDRVEFIMIKAVSISRENLVSLGTCFGKFTKSGHFRLHVTALDIIAPYAKYKVWGFGLASRTITAMRALDPTGICMLHQADVGEYLRGEDGGGIG